MIHLTYLYTYINNIILKITNYLVRAHNWQCWNICDFKFYCCLQWCNNLLYINSYIKLKCEDFLVNLSISTSPFVAANWYIDYCWIFVFSAFYIGHINNEKSHEYIYYTDAIWMNVYVFIRAGGMIITIWFWKIISTLFFLRRSQNFSKRFKNHLVANTRNNSHLVPFL